MRAAVVGHLGGAAGRARWPRDAARVVVVLTSLHAAASMASTASTGEAPTSVGSSCRSSPSFGCRLGSTPVATAAAPFADRAGPSIRPVPTGPRAATRLAIPIACVIRSITIARSMMQIPATTPAPDVVRRARTRPRSPRPPAPIRPAMITTDSTIMIVWFTPSRIEGRASGSCTFRSSLRSASRRTPRAASTVSFGHLADPQVGEPDPRRQRVDDRRDHAGDAPDANSATTGTR